MRRGERERGRGRGRRGRDGSGDSWWAVGAKARGRGGTRFWVVSYTGLNGDWSWALRGRWGYGWHDLVIP